MQIKLQTKRNLTHFWLGEKFLCVNLSFCRIVWTCCLNLLSAYCLNKGKKCFVFARAENTKRNFNLNDSLLYMGEKLLFAMILGASFAVAACSNICGTDAGEYAKFRKAPLLKVDTSRTINVADFGAVPNDGKNDFKAIKAAFAELNKNPKSVCLKFDKGVYNIKDSESQEAEKFLFEISNARDVHIDASGAEFIIENPNYGFLKMLKSERVVVENMSIDYDPLNWSEGVIESVDAKSKTLVMKIKDGFPSPTHRMFKPYGTNGNPDAAKGFDLFSKGVTVWGYQLDDNVPGRLKTKMLLHNKFSNFEDLGGGRVKFSYDTASAKYQPGEKLCVIARGSNTVSLFWAEYSSDISFIDIDAYATPSFFYKTLHSSYANFIRCGGLIKQGRWRGGNADFVHIQNAKNGPWIEGCHVEGIADDSLVFYTRPFYVSKVSEDGLKLTIRRAIWPRGTEDLLKGDVSVGDEMLFVNGVEGSVLGRVKIVAFDGKLGQITLEKPVENIVVGDNQRCTQVYNTAFSRNFVIKDCFIGNSRRYGTYWKGSNGIIENCTFEGLSNEAISMHNDAGAPNGPFCSDVIVRNNTFRDCGFDAGYSRSPSAAAIAVHSKPVNTGKVATDTKCYNNIVIENNNIESWNRRAICVRNCDGLVIRGNRIGSPTSRFEPEKNPVFYEYCENVKVCE